jgi:hypothetical protein
MVLLCYSFLRKTTLALAEAGSCAFSFDMPSSFRPLLRVSS